MPAKRRSAKPKPKQRSEWWALEWPDGTPVCEGDRLAPMLFDTERLAVNASPPFASTGIALSPVRVRVVKVRGKR